MSRTLALLRAADAPARLARFWSKVDRSEGCWNWTAATGAGGYGVFKLARGVTVTAHRLALVMETGFDPSDLQACHSCNNPLCARAEHLRWGTHQDNQDDRRRTTAEREALTAVLKTVPREHSYAPEISQTRGIPSRNWRVHAAFAWNIPAQETAQ